jgi:hypothetical protein
MNLQQKFLINFVIQEAEHHGLEIDPEFSVQNNLMRNVRRISEGEFLVLEVEGTRLNKTSKLARFEACSNISGDSILYSYQQLEKAFNEHHQFQGQF